MLIVIEGPMKSGKSSILIDMIDSFKAAHGSRGNLQVYGFELDTRNGDFIRSRDRDRMHPAKRVKDEYFETVDIPFGEQPCDVYDAKPPCLIVVDEAQFFGKSLLTMAWKANIVSSHVTLAVAGLELDSEGNPFGPMREIAAMANRVIRCKAICERCRQPADMTYCLIEKKQQVMVGDVQYEPRCKRCWKEGMHARHAKQDGG